MSRTSVAAVSCLLITGALTFGQSTSTILNETFESGLGVWTAKVYNTGAPNNNTPMIFTSTDPLLYSNIGNPGSQSAGYSSNMIDWDGQQPQYLRRQMPAAVAAGTYDVTFEMDVFVYYLSVGKPENADPWGVGNRVYALFDARYNDPGWDYNGGSPSPGVRKSYWPGDPFTIPGDPSSATWVENGRWRHIIITQSVTTTTGNIELRLLMHEKYAGPQAIAWDNVQFTMKQNGNTIFSFSDDFESGLGNWEAVTGLTGGVNNDVPTTFTPTDPNLFLNTGNPGSTSAGYSSSLPVNDNTVAAWLQRQFPGRVPPGTYHLRLEMDVYRYKDPETTDPWGCGNRVYVLTDDRYNDPTWNFDGGDPSPGFTLNYWTGWDDILGEDWSHNGVWQHIIVERELTTATGNLEVRLLLHDKNPGDQAVAWDNINLAIVSPCNDPRFDADGDKDVDQDDFGTFQECFNGSDAPAIDNPEVCRCMNSDAPDTDIDTIDLNAFTNCAFGPEIRNIADCDDTLPPL